MSELFAKIQQAVIAMKIDETRKLIEQGLHLGEKPLELLNLGLIPSLKIVGEKFKRDEIFLPEVMLSARAFKAGFDALKPLLLAGEYKPRAKVIIGTVAGDVHDIGKNIVAALLEGNGYLVIDLGVNVAPAKFVDAAKKEKPQVIGMSTLLTTTMPEMAKVLQALEAAGVRKQLKVIIGGAPVTREYAEKIQADGFGADAQEGVELINRWVESSAS
jgi:5-methyltetrahydrofolate--homocysteine methyltransferase